MNKIKEIFSQPEEVIDIHNIIYLLHLVFSLFVFVLVGKNYIHVLGYVIPSIFTIYFCLIKTSYGRKKFNYINQKMGYLLKFGIAVLGVAFLFLLAEQTSFLDFLNSLFMIITAASFFYWVLVLDTKEEINKKVFATEKDNRNIFNVICISVLGYYMIDYIVIFVEYGFDKYFMLDIIHSLFLGLVFILRLRYIYLYQEHIGKRREYYV